MRRCSEAFRTRRARLRMTRWQDMVGDRTQRVEKTRNAPVVREFTLTLADVVRQP